MPGETSEERALRLAAKGPRAYCSGIRKEIRRNHLLAGHDPGGRPPRLERLVTYIEDNLFEESLTVKAACRAVGIADTAIAGELRAYTGYTVDQFIARLRIEAAVHLVVHTQINASRIAGHLGFEFYKTFLRTYKIWTGETPEATRRHEIDPSFPFDFGSLRLLLRLGSGDLAPGEVCALHEELGELYPEVFGARQAAPRETGADLAVPVLDAEAFERFQVAELWPRLAELPFDEQRKLVRARTCWTPAPFKFLLRKARQEGRRDKKRGVDVARLALDCFDGNEDRLSPESLQLYDETLAALQVF